MGNQHVCDAHCVTMASIHLIRETAEYYAAKYKHDPFVRGMHEKYYEVLTSVIEMDRKLGGKNV